jgi:hypothetical protein
LGSGQVVLHFNEVSLRVRVFEHWQILISLDTRTSYYHMWFNFTTLRRKQM